jgi:hypothetical protein
MIATAADLLNELHARGAIAEIRATASRGGAPDRPWYIGLMLGVAGWMSGVCLLLFVALAFKPEAGVAVLVVGIVLIGLAWALFNMDSEGAFVPQLALALSVAGQFATLFGLGALVKGSHEIAGLALAAFVLQVALVYLMPNRLHRAMSALFATAAWALLVRYGLWDRSEGLAVRSAQSPALALLGWALAWPPVAGLLYYLIREEPRWMAAGRAAILRPAATGLIVGLALATLLSEPFAVFGWGEAANARSGWLAVWPILSVFAALAALAAAFALGQRGLAAVCIAAALAHMSHFYYAMGATLLVKSLALLVMGAAFLAAAHWLRRGGEA